MNSLLLRTEIVPRICLLSLTQRPFLHNIRTTFILKRQVQPFLKKADDKRHKRLRKRHFLYDLVEDTNVKPHQDVTVILTSYVEGLGDRGKVVSVRPGFARLQLLLPGLAVYASPENLQFLKDDILLSKEREPAYSSAFAPITMREMQKTLFQVNMNGEEEWTINPWHVRVTLRLAGYVVPETSIDLPSSPITGPNLDIQNKDFAVFLTINGREKFAVRCRLHHTGIELEDGWQLKESFPIFPEQEEILRGIPCLNMEKH